MWYVLCGVTGAEREQAAPSTASPQRPNVIEGVSLQPGPPLSPGLSQPEEVHAMPETPELAPSVSLPPPVEPRKAEEVSLVEQAQVATPSRAESAARELVSSGVMT